MTKTQFVPPGPGSWTLDTAHCDRPRSRYVQDLFERNASKGFRDGFATYGVLLDTIEFRSVGPFPYLAVRPLGAPPGASGTPPKWIFKLLTAVHPAIRRRLKRARHVVDRKVWREDIDRFWRGLPEAEAAIAALASEPIGDFDVLELAEHLARVGACMSQRVVAHFRYIPTGILPVGDFLAHVVAWTGATPREALAVLRGHSPASVAAVRSLEEAAAAIAADARARALLSSDRPPADTLAALRCLSGPVKEALGRLLERHGDAILSGFDLTELRIAELPDLLIAALRARVAAPSAAGGDPGAHGQALTDTLRRRVPEAHRATFDALLAEARAAYPVRDAHGSVDMWAFGVTRRALLEAGKRLAARGRLHDEADIFDATHDEIVALLRGESTPPAAEIAERAATRRSSRLDDAPSLLGPAPGEPPPADWLPPHAARLARAFGTYRMLMDDPSAAKDTSIVRGVGASTGRSTGTARLVLSAADFGKLRQGDILIAPTTTPTYNVILPLLGGIVTDRGGLLSHPAIVSREYGFPGIVGTRDATARIPDGALIEIDGDAGTVRVLTA